jgi:YYY domain-containing protein
MMDLIRWWLMLEILGLVALPLLSWLFPGLRDRGVSLARVTGLVLVAYPVWLFSHWGDFFGSAFAVLTLLLAGVCALVLFLVDWKRWTSEFKNPWELILSELVFHACFFLLAAVRSYNPEIEGMWRGGGSEKFMDLNFVNSILSSTQFPPHDNWLAGFPINYYYYGYYLAALLIKLTGVVPHTGYNLMVITVYALAIQGLWGLLRNLGCRWYTALLGVFLAFFAANLKAAGLSIEKDSNMLPWRASRVIDLPHDRTINEFPWFSYLWSDLHGHLSGMPLQTAVLGLCWGAVASIAKTGWVRQVLGAILLALTFGSLVVTNAWDTPAFACIVVLSVLAVSNPRRQPKGIPLLAVHLVLRAALTAAVFFVFFRPFFAYFVPPTSGYNLVPWGTKTPLALLFTLFGSFFAILALPFAGKIFLSIRGPVSSSISPGESDAGVYRGFARDPLLLALSTLLLVAWAGSVLFLKDRAGSIQALLTPVLLLTLAAAGFYWLLGLWLGRHRGGPGQDCDVEERFTAFLFLLGVGLILGCEFVAVKDFYGTDSMRLNTVFKFHLQAWLLLAIAAACLTDRLIRTLREMAAQGSPNERLFAFSGLALQALIVAVFTIWAAVGAWKVLYVKCWKFEASPTLNGIAYAVPQYGGTQRAGGDRDMSTDDALALLALLDLQRSEPDPNRIILETPGDPYSIFGRVSTFTGIPTLLGVANHEGIWNRGQTEAGREISKRERDANAIYAAPTLKRARELLDAYKVTHVFWGNVEKRKFGAAAERKFQRGMKAWKQFGETTVYSGYIENAPEDRETPPEIPPKPLAQARPVQDPSHPLDQPRGICTGPDGALYVCNSKKGSVDCFSPEGVFLRSYGSPGQTPNSGQLSPDYSGPGGVAVNEEGLVFVADTWNHRIAVFAPDGAYQREIKAEFWGPRNLAFYSQSLIVADTGKHRLVFLTQDGQVLRSIGGEGQGLGQFIEPVGLAVIGDLLFVADVGNQRIQVLGPDFTVRAEFPVLGWEDQVGTEAYLAADSKGSLWLSDSGQHRIEKFSIEGKLLGIYGPSCQPAGNLNHARGLAWRGENLLISDFGNNRLLLVPGEGLQ